MPVVKVTEFSPMSEKLALYPAHACQLCGEWEANEWMMSAMIELHKSQLCHTCNFWARKLSNYGTGFEKHFIVDGVCYLAHDSKSCKEGGPVMRGFGGREHIILFSDNTVIKTTNLWCQGDIPLLFREKLKDNAAFVYVDNAKWEDLELIKDGHWK